jgi:predicted RND superfamily exporter protein
MNVWAILMLVSAGLFSGGVTVFAWERIPVWRGLTVPRFKTEFATTIHVADRVQPALLVASIVTAAGFAFTSSGAARTLAIMGVAGFVVILVASAAVLVPLQHRIIASSQEQPALVEEMQRRWFRGHLGRSALGTASFVLVAIAVAV